MMIETQLRESHGSPFLLSLFFLLSLIFVSVYAII